MAPELWFGAEVKGLVWWKALEQLELLHGCNPTARLRLAGVRYVSGVSEPIRKPAISST